MMKLISGDALAALSKLKAESVQCVVTSPPYYNLRDYGTAEWKGGSASCDHRYFKGGHGQASAQQVTNKGSQFYMYEDVCRKCGAKRIDKQLGLENSPMGYIDHLVAIFDDVRRVLKDSGV